jgi:hypothetical protein
MRAAKWDAAATHLERATELEPTDAGVWADLGEAHARQGHVESAVAAVREAVTLDPDEPMYAFALGNLYYGPLGQPRRALPLLERAAAKRPDEPAALLSLARCLAALGRKDEARARLERARELAGGSAPLRASIEQALNGLADEAGAGATGTTAATAAGSSDADDGKPGILAKAGALVEGFLGALGATKDQAIGALLATLLGDDLKRLWERHAELARKSPDVTPLTLAQFQEHLGERIRLAVREGMEKASPEDLARAAELDKLLRVDELGMRKKGLLPDAKRGPLGPIIEAGVTPPADPAPEGDTETDIPIAGTHAADDDDDADLGGEPDTDGEGIDPEAEADADADEDDAEDPDDRRGTTGGRRRPH